LISEKFKSSEGRKIEFKETLPSGNKLERTTVAFSNDAGGEIFIGVKNEPRIIVGIPEDELIKLEEKISNLIYENCYPTIIPDIVFQNLDGKHIIIVKIYPGSLTPYYIKSLGKEKGTFIRVGSSNKLADREIIEELERRKRNISFDSTPFYEASPDELSKGLFLEDLSSFTKLYQEKTGKKITKASYPKLGLIKTEHQKQYPTVSAILLSNEIKQRYFPYAKIECARFKGTKTDTTIDAQTINESVCLQPDLALSFVERNIKKGSKIGRVYREERWEYPMLAVRELIINAVIHRDYSLQGKDIKVAIFDDMLEITSPGTIPPTIDLNNLTAGQSEIRNKTLAPIFKELQLIEQWGTGFKKLSDELKLYPEIELKFNEPGLSFQAQFIKKNYRPVHEEEIKLETDKHPSTIQVPSKYHPSTIQVELLAFCSLPRARVEIHSKLGMKNRKYVRIEIIKPLLDNKLMGLTIPDKPNSPKQKYITTEKGKLLLEELNK